MSESLSDNSPAIPAWRPSSRLCDRLLHGLIAVVLASGLTSAASVLQLTQNQQGFTVAMGLGFIAILPQIGILLAYLGLARETNSDGLKRTSVGIFGAGWIMQLLEVTDESILPEQAITAVRLIALVAAIGLLLYCFYPLLRGAGCGVVLFVILAVRSLRFLPKLLPGLKELDPTTQAIFVVGGLGLLALLIVDVWFAISLIQLRDRLGSIAAVKGWAHLLGVIAAIAGGAWFISEIVTAANHPEAIDQAPEELIGRQLQTVIGLSLAGELLSAALTALLFWFVRQRGQSQSENAWSGEGVS